MREWLWRLWTAPAEQFSWFMASISDNVLYLICVLLLLRWLWRKGNAPKR
jgi:hypothetical protein